LLLAKLLFCGITVVACIQTVIGVLAVVAVLLVSDGLLFALPAIAGIPGVSSVSEVPFELDAAGTPAVISFPAVDGVLAVASISADPGFSILAGGFTYWTVQVYNDTYYWTIELSDYGYRTIIFCCYRNIQISDCQIQETIRLRKKHQLPTSGY
jgi:hypothetical protein